MKRILSLVLAVMLVFGTTTLVSAAEGTLALGMSSGTGVQLVSSWDLGDIHPNNEFNIYILVEDASGNYSPITKTQARNLNLDVRMKSSKGSNVVSGLEIKYDGAGQAYVQIKFIKRYVSVKEQDVDISIYLTQNKNKVSSTETTVYGTFENYTQDAYANDDYFYLVDVPVVEAHDYIKQAKVELGAGVSVYARMYEGNKYYGYCYQYISGEDNEIIAKYPGIETVYYLNTIGLGRAGNGVTIDSGSKMYVYDAELYYLGTTSDYLPYSTKYYVSSVQLDVDGDRSDEDIDPDDDDIVPGGDAGGTDGAGGSGGVGGSGGGGSTIPDTGSVSYVGVAVMAGLLALATMGALTLKKKRL